MVRAPDGGWPVGFDRYDADDADDEVTMMVRKSVSGWGLGSIGMTQ